jgi:uncharacterized membrane protein YjjP (DUF1212 family)
MTTIELQTEINELMSDATDKELDLERAIEILNQLRALIK